MTLDNLESHSPQCQFFVLRKKRLCRMTVRPGHSYCGEHQPDPGADGNNVDSRIPCPNDPKHTCFASKLAKHLTICNARLEEHPAYIQKNVNTITEDSPPKKSLTEIPLLELRALTKKVNQLFEQYVQNEIETLTDRDIHPVVVEEFALSGRTESSLRHLRQVSRLMYVIEEEEMVQESTCYVELGAGKGQLSYFAWQAWCATSKNSRVLCVERASLRHKHDNKIRNILRESNPKSTNSAQANDGNISIMDESTRLRADLAHLLLHAVPSVEICKNVVGFAKHLCGVATDYSLRCLVSPGVISKTQGILIATCCHHRCQRDGYVANEHLLDLGLNAEEFNIILGVVSWATCGDGRSRSKKTEPKETSSDRSPDTTTTVGSKGLGLSREEREEIGRRAKALLDWGRVLYLRKCGFSAHLAHYVPNTVSLENICIIAKRETP
ncbi:unnamed protein product [Leptosia nina]|uniref:tRNA:m(4)X modification enzyme TRM13 n=1 Tax=Leptosia nina TaxID=320188 RepID=A0AAV1J229_9NEOP